MRFAFDIEVSIAAALLLAWNWRWLMAKPPGQANWRHKAAMTGLAFATTAAALFLIAALIRHSPGMRMAEVEFRTLEFMGGLGIAGIVSALLGAGTPRIFAAVWSILMILLCFLEFGVSGH